MMNEKIDKQLQLKKAIASLEAKIASKVMNNQYKNKKEEETDRVVLNEMKLTEIENRPLITNVGETK